MGTIVVVGGGLPGMAAAARLARVGHDVTLVERRDHLGGRLARPGVWAPVLDFPAPLRDLFRKSGKPFDAEFGRRGLRLVPAPPAVHAFPDGTELAWPTDRGEQWHAVAARYGADAANSWRDALDGHDETWQTLRHLGLEAELTDARQVKASGLRGRPSVEALARRSPHPHLADLVRDAAWRIGSRPPETPGWLASRLSVERTFGRWILVDAHDDPQPLTLVLDVLAERLATRGVRVLTSTDVVRIAEGGLSTATGRLVADAVVSCVNPWEYARLLGERAPRIAPALAPLVTVRHVPGRLDGERIEHTPAGPVVTYHRPTSDGTEVIVHDHTRPRPDAGAGVRWRGARTWLRLPPLRRQAAPGLFAAAAGSRGGNEPWAQLLSAALAVYAAHELLNGEDIRPTNRAYRP